MRLSWSFATRRREFSRAMRRIRPAFESLLAEFSTVSLQHPIHEAVLVGIWTTKRHSSRRFLTRMGSFRCWWALTAPWP